MRTFNRVQVQKLCVSKFKDVCRLCMNSDTSMYDIFDISEEDGAFSLSLKILKCLSIEVKDTGEFPTKLCSCCYQSLNAFAEFWEQCHETDKKLQQLIEKSNQPTLFEETFLSSSPSSAVDEYYNPSQDDELVRVDEDQSISETPNQFAHKSTRGSTNLISVENRESKLIIEEPSSLSSKVAVEVSKFTSSQLDLLEKDIDSSVDVDISSKVEVGEVSDISDGGSGLEVQVSMNGNSYIVKVLEQSGEKDTAPAKEAQKDVAKNSMNSEVIVRPLSQCKVFYQCPHCKDSFDKTSDLKDHMKQHVEAKQSMCQICSKWFAFKSSLVRHERTHSGERPHKCDLCSKSFTQKEILRRHRLTHSGEKPFKCESCDKSYTQKVALAIHIKNNHVPRNSVEIIQYKCSLCDKSFCHPSGLSRHQQSHAGRKYPCKNCHREFTDQSCLKRHNQRIHLKEKNQSNVEKITNKNANQAG